MNKKDNDSLYDDDLVDDKFFDDYDISGEKAKEVFEKKEQTQVNFYKFDKSKPYKVEGGGSQMISSLIFLWIGIGLLILDIVIFMQNNLNGGFDIISLVPYIFLSVFALIFLIVGFNQVKKSMKRKIREQAILNNCTLTDATVTSYSCVRRTTRHDDHSHTRYDVTLTYSFTDDRNTHRTETFEHTYTSDPEFYKGQHLIVAFNSTDSLILSKFTLVEEDKRIFEQNEASRSNDDFDSLTGGLLDIDMSQPIKGHEGKWDIILPTIFVGAYLIMFTIIFFTFLLPVTLSFDSLAFVPLIIGGVVVLFFALPISFFAKVIIKSLKNRSNFKKVISSNPYFTYGKMFASEKTYRAGAKKQVMYCYIDKWGEKHTKTETSLTLCDSAQGEDVKVLVAYTANGESTIVKDYTLIKTIPHIRQHPDER